MRLFGRASARRVDGNRVEAGISRRMVLTGIGGAALAIPLLPSLLEKPAAAGSPITRPRFMWFGTDHGGCWDQNFFPTSVLTQTATAAPGHTVNAGALAPTTASGRTTLSAVLNASSTTLTPTLTRKLNVLRGLDVPFYLAHNTGLHLGNYARNDGNGSCGTDVTNLGMRPTIDQIMATSSSFYNATDLAGTTLKSMVINPGRQLSWAFSNPAQGTASAVQYVQGLSSSLQLFNAVFGSAPKADAGAPRPPVVDKVLASYNSLRQSNTRMSAADLARLDTHIAMIDQLQSSLNAQLQCTRPSTPTDDADNHQQQTTADATTAGQLWCDIVAAAFACDASRIGVFGWGDTAAFSSYTGNDWHHDVAHEWDQDTQQALLVQSYQNFFERVFVYLAAKLDSIEDASGGSVLDNTLMGWSQECCMATHQQFGVPVVTAGGAGGYLNTGLYCDYRQMNEPGGAIVPSGAASSKAITSYTTYPGLLYAQWLGTALQSMGITPATYELWKDGTGASEHGYGTPYIGTDENAWKAHYATTASSYFAGASDPLPFLKAG
jgi:hypothetical protein